MPHPEQRSGDHSAHFDPRTDRSLSVAECSTFCAIAGPASQMTVAAVIAQTYETLIRDRLPEAARAQLPRDDLRFGGLVGINVLRRHAELWPATRDERSFIPADLFDLGLPKRLVVRSKGFAPARSYQLTKESDPQPLQVERHYLHAENGGDAQRKARVIGDGLQTWPSLLQAVQRRVDQAFAPGDRNLHSPSVDPVYRSFANLAAESSVRHALGEGTHLLLPRCKLDETGWMNWS